MRAAAVSKWFFAGILFAAFFLRAWNVWNQDIWGDEATYAFRSIGYIDFLGTSFQTQPIDWYKDRPLPLWARLSFHDHPPLAFAIQHVFFAVFGDSLFVARLPSIILGTLAVFIFYLIVRRLLGEGVARIAAVLFAVTNVPVAIFRTALLEPFLLFFLLLNIYAFFLLLENRRRWWLFGLTLGLLILTKYTGAFIVAVYLVYLALYRRRIYREWRLYAASTIALAVFSPVIAYNIFLYKARGHFDLQFAYLFGQNTPEWSGLLGKIQAPFSEVWANLVGSYGIPMLELAALGLVLSVVAFVRKMVKADASAGGARTAPQAFSSGVNGGRSAIVFFWLYLAGATLFLWKIGSAYRFLTLYLPAFTALAAIYLTALWNIGRGRWRHVARIAVVLVLLFELGQTTYRNFIVYEDYGIAALDHYFDREFKDKESGVTPEADNANLNEVIKRFAGKNTGKKERMLAVIVYNDNIALGTTEWIFYRRFFYRSTPTLYVENFAKILKQQGDDYFKGFTIYFVQSTPHTLLNPLKEGKTTGAELERQLVAQGVRLAETVYGRVGAPMFKIYKFSL